VRDNDTIYIIMKRVTIDYDNIQTQSGDDDKPLKLNPKRYEEGDDDEEDEVSDEDVAMKSASAAGIYKSKPKSSSDLKSSQRTGIGIEEDEDVNDDDDSENDDDDDDDYEESGDDDDDDDNGSNYSYENDEAEEADTGKDKEGDGEGDGEGDEEDEADSTGDVQNDEDEDYDSETGEDDRYRKINQEFRQNYIAETHPESKGHTDDEIHALAKVVRDKTGTIVDPLHRTIPVLTKYEKTRILGIRTKQLNNGAEPYITSKVNITSEKVIDGYPIALRELEEKKLPFIIRRPLPGGGMEYWYLQDLEIL
jgi:DNA-directed RNA polymerase subunit K/omega